MNDPVGPTRQPFEVQSLPLQCNQSTQANCELRAKINSESIIGATIKLRTTNLICCAVHLVFGPAIEKIYQTLATLCNRV